MAKILGVGIATLDIINLVDHYPAEDEEMRALGQRVTRGGNCTNTLTVLAQLGHACSWAGVYADEPDGKRILDELQRYDIDHQSAMLHPGGKVPTSYITLNQATGSRTIIHYRDLPELPYVHFASLDLAPYAWVHFEGRNPEETLQMLQRCRAAYPELSISLEVEKPRPGMEALMGLADVVLYSRAYARNQGYGEDATDFLRQMQSHAPKARLYVGWGEHGAYALEPSGQSHHSPAFAPPQLVDTIGAGDSFNAAVIHAAIQERDMAASLDYACRLAGYKCGRSGLDIEGFALA